MDNPQNVSLIRCSVCGQKILESSRFCSYCGTSLRKESFTMSIKDAAQTIGCSNNTIRNLVDRGVLVRVGSADVHSTYIDRESVVRFCCAYPDFPKQISKIEQLENEIMAREMDLEKFRISIHKDMIDAMSKSFLPEEDRKILKEISSGKTRIETICTKHNISRAKLGDRIETIIKSLKYHLINYETLSDPTNVIFELNEQNKRLKHELSTSMHDYDRLLMKYKIVSGKGNYPIIQYGFSNSALALLERRLRITSLDEIADNQIGHIFHQGKAGIEIIDKMVELGLEPAINYMNRKGDRNMSQKLQTDN